MPVYGSLQAGGTPTALQPGDGMVLFAGEILAPPVASIPFARGFSPEGGGQPIVFTASWAVAPTAVVNIQGSNVDADAAYVTLGTITDQNGFYADSGGFEFYRAQLFSQAAGGALTVQVQR